MKCSRGLAKAQIEGGPICQKDAVRFFHSPVTGFCFAACPEHAKDLPPRKLGYIEVTQVEYEAAREGVLALLGLDLPP